jgi:hypothetical protein
MNSHSNLSSLQALPDGEAELQLVVHLRWEDLAALGREASRLAVRLQRPVGLDEAATQHLRSRLAAPAAPAPEPAAPQAAPAAPIAITAGAGMGAGGGAEQSARHRVQQVPQVSQVQQPQAAPTGVAATMTSTATTPTVSSLAGRTPPPEPTLPGSAA